MPPQLDELLARVDLCSTQAIELSTHFQELREQIRQAIDIAQRDPEMSLIRARKVLEYIVVDIYDEALKPKRSGTQPLEGLVQALVKEGQFPNRLAAYADMVRGLGNEGAHGRDKGVTSQDVLNSLSNLLPIVEWFFEHRKTPSAEGAPPAATVPNGSATASPPRAQPSAAPAVRELKPPTSTDHAKTAGQSRSAPPPLPSPVQKSAGGTKTTGPGPAADRPGRNPLPPQSSVTAAVPAGAPAADSGAATAAPSGHTARGSNSQTERIRPAAPPQSVAGLGFEVRGTIILLLCLYAVNTISLVGLCQVLDAHDRGLFGGPVFLGLVIGALQTAFVLSAGTSDPLSPIRNGRRWLPILVAGFWVALLLFVYSYCFYVTGILAALTLTGALWGATLLSCGIWIPAVWIYSKKWSRLTFVKRMCQIVLGGSFVGIMGLILSSWISKVSVVSTEESRGFIFLAALPIVFTLGPAAVWLKLHRALQTVETEREN